MKPPCLSPSFMPSTWTRTTTFRKKYRPTAMPTPRKARAVATRMPRATGSSWPRVVPTTSERMIRLRISSTTAAPMIVSAIGRRMRPRSRRTAAAIAVLVAVRGAPTKGANVNCVPVTRKSVAGTEEDAEHDFADDRRLPEPLDREVAQGREDEQDRELLEERLGSRHRGTETRQPY